MERTRRGKREMALEVDRATRADDDDPDRYKSTRHHQINADVEDIYRQWDELITPEQLEELSIIVRALAADPPADGRALETELMQHRKRTRRAVSFRKAQLLHAYHSLVGSGEMEPCPPLQQLLVKKSSKSQSGVLVITVLTSPYPEYTKPGGERVKQAFSCAWNCYYCPSEPDQPKSYLHDEPAVKRANENHFDPVMQLTDRAATLAMNGHPVDKIELLVLGGTWSSYPHEYQEEFVRDLFYGANTFWQRTKRARLSLLEEQSINETAQCKIIGLTLETRPDTIDADELRRLRRYGCTRLQLGVQHTDDGVLKKINRGCTTAQVATALRRLKNTCYKVDIHLMPNLPGSSAELDRAMFERVLSDPDLQADQWKVYPTQVVPWTIIKRWFEEGKFVPYSSEQMFDLLMQVKARVHPWIRLNRVVRDIPIQYVSGGLDVPNLREDLLTEMARKGLACRCIRCREPGATSGTVPTQVLVRRVYAASGGAEHFLSIESEDRCTLLGFVRLRLPPRKPVPPVPPLRPTSSRAVRDDEDDAGATGNAQSGAGGEGIGGGRSGSFGDRSSSSGGAAPIDSEQPFPELIGAALVREVHVYGQLISTADKNGADAQHTGIGRRLMGEAEATARAHGYRRVAVIAGIGSRGYYRKLGYELEPDEGQFMMKSLGMFAPGWVHAWMPPREAVRAGAAVLGLLLLLLVLSVAACQADAGGRVRCRLRIL